MSRVRRSRRSGTGSRSRGGPRSRRGGPLGLGYRGTSRCRGKPTSGVPEKVSFTNSVSSVVISTRRFTSTRSSSIKLTSWSRASARASSVTMGFRRSTIGCSTAEGLWCNRPSCPRATTGPPGQLSHNGTPVPTAGISPRSPRTGLFRRAAAGWALRAGGRCARRRAHRRHLAGAIGSVDLGEHPLAGGGVVGQHDVGQELGLDGWMPAVTASSLALMTSNSARHL